MSCLWQGGPELPGYSRGRYGSRDVTCLWRGARRTGAVLSLILDRNLRDEIDLFFPLTFEGHGIGGWSNMLEAFRPDMWPAEGERIVHMDLDTVIVGDCDWLWEWDKAPLGFPLDPYRRDTICSGIRTWDRRGAQIMWEAYLEAKKNGMSAYKIRGAPSEMMLMRKVWRDHGWPTLEPEPEKLLSYKVHVKKGADWQKASAVYFHGSPKPQDLPEGDPLRMVWES